MSARIFDFTMANMTEPVKLASMPWKRTKAFVNEGRELLKDVASVPPERWTERRDNLVQESFERAGGSGDVTELFDGDQLNEMQVQIMNWSGLKTKAIDEVGEAIAASISSGSKAA